MNSKEFYKLRLCFTAIVSIAIWALLIWQHNHGGVPSHHIAADASFPAISNWWGAALLPLLTWYLLYRVQKRLFRNKTETRISFKNIIYRFAGALLFGSLIAICFTLGYEDKTGYLVLGMLPFAIFIPIYRAECLLGFVLGMTFTFGAALPTGFGILVSLMGIILYWLIRPGIYYALSKITILLALSKQKPQQ
ncbi:hypothetical protein [Pontibacter burrus]|uniref:hypothetical protein n=1 Tax=Pontibacter burrus TaxID=2704466 RepID=UPI001954E853|nr:hypothetical protein [Pontibacter burrus]